MDKKNTTGNTSNNSKSTSYTNFGSQQSNTNSFPSMPTINLPKGGGAIKSIEEKFKVNSSSGTFAFSIPVPLSPARNGTVPALSLNYNSGAGNSPFGLGWNLSTPSISRKTEKKLPEYKDAEESDTFILSYVEDLVPLLEETTAGWVRYSKPKTENGIEYTVKRYRPRVESSFFIIEKWENDSTGEVFWKTITKDNIHSFYGLTAESRISDPNDASKIFSWLICKTYDDKGSLTLFKYKKEDFANVQPVLSEKNRIPNCTQVYLKEVLYGNRTPYYHGDADPSDNSFLFRIILDYGEHDTSESIPKDIHLEKQKWSLRSDVFSSYRSGFEIRTYRRCNRILVFHCFDAPELPHSPYLVKSLKLFYKDSISLPGNGERQLKSFSCLTRFRHEGHAWNASANNYSTKFLPEIEITYQDPVWDKTIRTVSEESLVHAPVGVDSKKYLWVDLFNEGISGILTEQSGGWYYKYNLGNGNFSNAVLVAETPSFKNISSGEVAIMDLEGNGDKYLVHLKKEPRGFFKMNERKAWENFKSFESLPVTDPLDPNMKPIDLTGDGSADMLLTEETQLRWYQGKGEKGFVLSQTVAKEIDEEKGPAIIFSDLTQSLFLADMDGNGLTDLVRIRNGEICYWPNLGYGRFGAKVSMENAPLFDHPDLFNPAFLRLADIDGSGTTDVIYLGKKEFKIWMNLFGKEFTSEPEVMNPFPQIDNLSDVSVMDLLGTGTSCIVYSSPGKLFPLQYMDLMGSKKPYLLSGYHNSCGKYISVEYKSSTHFYLEDKKEGRKWVTTLPFPVQCVYKIRSEDKIRQSLFVNSYRYSHGYFDSYEKEFRGFARVEQFDSETFDDFKINQAGNVVEEALHQPPLRTVTWMHTGAYLSGKNILHQCESEYFTNNHFQEYSLPEPQLPSGLSAEEMREAMRAFKGMPLRAEVYATDNTDKEGMPYTASGSTYKIKRVQPKGPNSYASFLVELSESISYTYERNPADPRINHSCILQTDKFGNVEKSASIIYPRVKRPMDALSIPDKVWEQQNKLHSVYQETFYTDDIQTDSAYRLRGVSEIKSYELSGLTQPVDFFITRQNLQTFINATSELGFDVEFTTGAEKRLSSHTRNYYIKDDLSGPMQLGKLSAIGIGFKTHRLAFTKNLVTKLFGSKVTDQMLSDSQYIHSESDDQWWAPSGEIIFPANAKSKFYIPIGCRDVAGNESFMEYDKYSLLLVSTTDASGAKTTSVNDYRLLSTSLVIDPNLNRSAVENDELGLVVKSAVMGKEGAADGDTLSDPTARMEYDLFNWKNNGKPNFVHSFMRKKHGPSNTEWQESYFYSDGSGSIIMMKDQAEPGKAKRWNTVTAMAEEVDANPRWVGNGRAILNNKGKPVKNYQPYFSTTHEYESEAALVETGVSSTYFYDPIGKNILTKFPNGTFSKIEFTPWLHASYDVNDTVKESQWYADRGSPDPASPEPTDPETRAAWLAAKHAGTPTVIHSDSRGKSFYTVADYGNGKTTSIFSESDLFGRFGKSFDQMERMVSEEYINLLGTTVYSKTAEKGERWVLSDVLGRTVKLWDNNTQEFRNTYDKLHRPVCSFIKEGGNEIMFSRMVYGDILPDAVLKNMVGRLYQLYDQSGQLTITEVDFKGNQLKTERKLAKKYDEYIDWKALENLNVLTDIETTAAPILETEVFRSSSQVDALNRPVMVVYPDNSIVESVYNVANYLDSIKVKIRGLGEFITFLENQDYDARGLRQSVRYGNGLTTNYRYDADTFRLVNVNTNVAGESDSQSRQNIFYTYDPAGNIIHTIDQAQQTHFFNNSVVTPESFYEYDAIYQLKRATGREHAGLGNDEQRNQNDLPFNSGLPHANNTNALRTYEEKYHYDDCGNIVQLQHIATGATWNQNYRYNYQDNPGDLTNRLKATSLPGDPEAGPFSATYSYDNHGNCTSMPHLAQLNWNFMNQLKSVDLGGGGNAFYVYGVGGSRIRKVIERIGGKRIERIYLGTVEIYREYLAGVKKLERSTLHVADNTGRIAQIDTKVFDPDNSDPDNLLGKNLIRYCYHNHLGTCSLETDETGTIISYEEYHPYGTSSYRSSKSSFNLSLKRYRFSGKERDDETGLYYFGARYYAPWLARWTSSDPGGFTGGMNLFRYCSNSPIVHQDPNGMDDYPTIWTSKDKYTKEEKAILNNPKSDPEKVLEILTAHGYKQGGPLEWKSDYGKHGGWVRMDKGTSDMIGTGDAAGTGNKKTEGGDKGGSSDKGSAGGSQTGSDKGSEKGSDKGSDTGSDKGSAGGTAGGIPEGSKEGKAGGSATGSPQGTQTGKEGGSSPGETGTPGGEGGGGGGRKYITNSFWRGLLTGFAIAVAIVLFVALAPITIPASVAIGAAVIGIGLTAYSITQAVRQRDLFNRPISEEQANYNLGMGIGGILGGFAGGSLAGPTGNALNQAGQGFRSFGMQLALEGVGSEGAIVVSGGTAVAGTSVVTGTGIATGTGVLMMESGDSSGSGGSSGGSPVVKKEFHDLDDAAEAVLGKGSEMGAKIGDIGPIKNQGVIDDLKAIGYDPNDFRAVQYWATSGDGKNYILTIFEAEGGVYFGPHLSSANW